VFPSVFIELPLGSVLPLGWLMNQLRVQANGLSGAVESVWPDLGSTSAWKGGDGESWERGPYYLDGLVPLAHLLNSDELKERAQVWLECIFASQRQSGSFGPENPKSKWGPGWWHFTPVLKALCQHYEATGDGRVLPLLSRFFHHQSEHLAAIPLREWSASRAGETDLVLQWLHAHTGEDFLVEHMKRLREGSLDWTEYFHQFAWPRVERPVQFRHDTHIVNVVMALKYPMLWSLWSEDEKDRTALPKGLHELDQHHGQANGLIGGDEHLAGRDPTQGSELCSVVELMFSLEHLLRISGDPMYGDRLEQVAYNSLPAAFDARMRIHQYDQQVNQVLCTDAPRHWMNNGNQANLFGLAPEFGCCTANYHQGWPKLVSHLWMGTNDGGLATGALGPSVVSVDLADHSQVRVVEETGYPFSDEVTFTVETKNPARFPLYLRIPAWCSNATVDDSPVAGGRYHRIERTFHDGDQVKLRLPRTVRGERRERGALSLYLGPLLLALPIDHEMRLLEGQHPIYGNHEVVPRSAWNYALQTDEKECSAMPVRTSQVSKVPFDDRHSPIRVAVEARKVSEWKLVEHCAGPAPKSPVRCRSHREAVDLVPYGSTRLRVAEFPTTR